MKSKLFLPFVLVVLGYQSQSFAQDTEVFQVDFALWGSIYADWNKTDNVNPNTVAVVLPSPIQTLNGLDLPISISVEREFEGPNYSGMTSGIYPSNVMKRGYYVGSGEGIIKLAGLDLNKKYTITCFGSKSAYTNEDYTTIYTDVTNGAGGITASLNAYQNTSNTIDLEDLVPNSNGEILLSVTKDANALSGYINAIVVTISDNFSTSKPDLAIISSTFDPPDVRPEDEIQIETTVQNIGEADADATNLRYYLSDDGILDGSDILLGKSLIKDATTGLSQGEPITVQATVEIPAGTAIGDKYIIQVVDLDNVLDESNEGNNENVQAFSILEPPTIRYVAVSGSDATGDGSAGNPFLTIQHGIDHMNPDDTLYMRKGTYTIENPLVLKSRICIKGEDHDKTIIRRIDTENPDDIEVFKGEELSNIALNDFKILAIGYNIAGIALNSCENIKFEGITFISGGSGIVFNNVSNAELVNNTIRTGVSGAEFGLKSSGQSGFFIIKNNVISDFEYCVYFDNLQCTPEISYNDVFSGGGINYTGILDQTGLNGNISDWPEYYDYYAPNGILSNTSSCIDAGDPSILDPDGSLSDIGANPYLPEIIYVSTNGSDITGDGGFANPYGSLQYGLDEAKVYDTIQVMAGTHQITQTLYLKSGVYIRGDDPLSTTIFRDYPWNQDLNFEILKLEQIRDVTIENLKLATYGSREFMHTAIDLDGAHNITINRCVLYSFYNAILASYSEFVATNNTMIGQIGGGISGDGVYGHNSSQISLINNIIGWFGNGINLSNSSFSNISYNNVVYNSDGTVSNNRNYVGIPDQTGLSGNISDHPEFSDFYSTTGILSFNSPCIDAGDPNSPLDPDGTRADIGAIPYNQSTVTPLELTSIPTHVSCFGGDDGAIDLTVSGGLPPYSFSWSNGETTEDITGLVARTYTVIVTDQADQANSATIDISDIAALVPDICVITVDDATGSLKVTWLPQEGIELHNIYRESNETDIYELIGTVSSGAGSFVDVNADPDIRSYRYKISALDPCGGETELSAHHKSMHLTVNVGLNDEVNLIWDAYEGFDYSSYNIQRGPSPENISEHLATVPANIHSYTDLFSSVSSSYYRIEVVSNNICGTPSSGRITEKPVSRSNVASREDAVTSLNDHVLDGIKIFPNPADKFIHINVPEDLGILKELTIRNLTGKLMEHKTFHLRKENSIDIGNLHSGVYILTLDLSNTKSFNKKVFINH